MNLSDGWLKATIPMKEAYRFLARAFRVPVPNLVAKPKSRQQTMKNGKILLSEDRMWKRERERAKERESERERERERPLYFSFPSLSACTTCGVGFQCLMDYFP